MTLASSWRAVRARLSAEWAACWRPQPTGWREPGIALLLALVYLVWLFAGVDDVGYARDEGFYFQAAEAYQRWFELLASDPARALEQTDRYWRNNSEHPALLKSLFALSHWFGHQRWGLFAHEGTSFRFPAMLLSSLAVACVYLWGARVHGRLAGGLAALSLGAMPRFFFHSHLACFDTAVVALWCLCAYAYWAALCRGGWKRCLWAGVALALVLNTKHNSWFLPIVCGAHAAALQWPGVVMPRQRALLRRRSVAVLAAMAVVGPLLFYATWPWLWHDTLARLRNYANFHLHHVYYNMEYLGENYFQPPMPRSYAFVMTAATVPLVTLAAFLLGAGRSMEALRGWWRKGEWAWWRNAVAQDARELHHDLPELPSDTRINDPATLLLWWLALSVQYAAWLSPSTPIFGGTKHWMTAYPFLVLIGAYGVRHALRSSRIMLRQRQRRMAPSSWLRGLLAGRRFEWAACMLLLAPGLVQAQRVHPWGLSSYNALVGGAPGAATLGLNRGFWGYTTASMLPHLNAQARPRARLYLHDTAYQAWDMLRRDGKVRKDIVAVPRVAGAEWSLYHHEMHMAGEEAQAWMVFGHTAPRYIEGLDGVPIVWLYGPPER